MKLDQVILISAKSAQYVRLYLASFSSLVFHAFLSLVWSLYENIESEFRENSMSSGHPAMLQKV